MFFSWYCDNKNAAAILLVFAVLWLLEQNDVVISLEFSYYVDLSNVSANLPLFQESYLDLTFVLV